MGAEAGVPPGRPWSGVAIDLALIPFGLVALVAALMPVASLHPYQGDVAQYLDISDRIVAGQVPYRDFHLVYPPLALLPMLIPRLVWPGQVDLGVYAWLFAVQNGALAGATGVVTGRIADRWLPDLGRDRALMDHRAAHPVDVDPLPNRLT
jgi:hypothetical protein